MKKNRSKISVFNKQRKHSVETKALRDFLYQLSDHLAPHLAFSVVLLSDARITDYNLRFRGQDRATDVLSFPCERDDWEEEPYLGDILISTETAHRQKKGPLLNELKILSLHGILHLLGHDHETDQGEMKALEGKLKKEFKLH